MNALFLSLQMTFSCGPSTPVIRCTVYEKPVVEDWIGSASCENQVGAGFRFSNMKPHHEPIETSIIRIARMENCDVFNMADHFLNSASFDKDVMISSTSKCL